MKQCKTTVLALLSILTLVTITTPAIAESDATHFSGNVEIGVTGTDIKDNPARINEYNPYDFDEGLNPKVNINFEAENKGYVVELESSVNDGADDQKHSLELDLNRTLRLDFDYLEFKYWQDQETLDQMGATARDDIGGAQPNVTTDKIYADLIDLTGNPQVKVGGQALGDYDPAAAYTQEVNNDYLVTRREYKGETELALPFAPNVVFHAGLRIEKREGMEQAIGVDKCTSCHVSAVGKDIDERTEDLTLGATGKFGIFTVDYEYLNRDFSENGSVAERYYTTTGHANSYQLLYGTNAVDTPTGWLELSKTPDSEKDSHSVRVRADFSNSTSVTASYVQSDIESTKEITPEYELLEGNTLETEYESFGGKVATKIGDLRLSLRGSTYEIESGSNEVFFQQRLDDSLDKTALLTRDISDDYETAEEREVKEFGIDAVYPLTTGTTLRLGYEYEEVDREEHELGSTETQTFKAAVKSRINKSVSGRLSYQYQNIDDPMTGAHVGIGQGDTEGGAVVDPLNSGAWSYTTADFTIDGKEWYWNAVYPNRQLESSNQPDEVHEAKATTTWAINPNMAATLFARVRMEENNDVKYEQTTYVPGATIWYAPTGNMNLTMAYTFNKQETENQMCVGWYHG